MDNQKIKVWNRTKGNHGFVYSDRVRTILIPPGGFVYLPIDEVYYTDASTKSFKKGILEIDPMHTEIRAELGYTVENPNALSEADIQKLLEGKFTDEVKEKLEGITERHGKQKVIDIARKLDLTQSKINFIEEVTGMEVFNELIKEEIKEEAKKPKPQPLKSKKNK